MSADENNSRNSGAVTGVALRSASYSKLNQQDPESGEKPEPKPRRPLVSSRWQFSRTKCLFVSLVILAAILFIGLGLGYGLKRIKEDQVWNGGYTTDMEDDGKPFRDYLIGPNGHVHLQDYSTGSFKKAAVVSHSPICAKIANDVLKINGTAVDAAIAALLCEGVSNPQSMGLGGGFLMLHYDRKSSQMTMIDAREVAPLAATQDMFLNRSDAAQVGPLSIAVPGELRGYDEVHKKFGRVQWARLFEPTIKLCREGVLLSRQTLSSLKRREKEILKDPTLREIFVNKDTNQLLKEHDVMKRFKLAETLEKIAENGAEELYTGNLSKALIQDIKDAGGLLTEEDLHSYTVFHRDPVVSHLENNLTMYSVSSPGSGAIVAFLVNILQHVWADLPTNLTAQEKEVLVRYRFIEACKYAYVNRPNVADGSYHDKTQMEQALSGRSAAMDIANEILSSNATFDDPLHYSKTLKGFTNDYGTAHVSVLDAEGNAVSVTSTLNLWLGSAVISPSTGIIMNDEMDDFSMPGTPNTYGLEPNPDNYIEPGKRPASSMIPTMFLDDNGDVKYIFGGAGGSRIISAIADVYGRHAFLGETILQALTNPRLHHQLIPNKLEYEPDVPEYLKDKLRGLGHKVMEEAVIRTAVSVISRGPDDRINAYADRRRRGGAAGI